MPQFWPPAADDTGWLTVALSSPWTTTGEGVQYRRKNGVVTVTILALHSSSFSTTTTLFTLPAGFRPSHRVIGDGVFANGRASIYVLSSGVVQVGGDTTTALAGIAGSVAFPI